jgi:hypothetical protein
MKKKINLFDEKDKFYSYSSYTGVQKQSYAWLEMTKRKYSLWGKIWRVVLGIFIFASMLTLAFLSKKYGN